MKEVKEVKSRERGGIITALWNWGVKGWKPKGGMCTKLDKKDKLWWCHLIEYSPNN